MLHTTTPSIEGHVISKYHGIVSGETIMGANIVRDVFASVTDVVGGRSGAYESKLTEAREVAIREMSRKAERLGANAVVGIDLDFEMVRSGMMMCIATGTAVTYERK